MLAGGLHLWPAIWVGAFVANAGSDAPLWTAFAIATGNTLEAVAAVWWLRRLAHVEHDFQRVADVLAFVVVAAAVAALRGTGGHVEVVITDTGAGISPEFLPFVFEPFRQAESRFDRGRGGLGLGLAIAKQLVELHGGTIEAARRDVHGTATVRG